MRMLRGAVGALPPLLAMTALLLVTPGLAAGVWAWPTAWIFLAVFGAVSMIASGLLAALCPASFQVRQQGYVAAPEKRQPWIDAIGLPVYLLLIVAWLAFIPLDVFRLRLMPSPAPVVQALGAAGAICGLVLANLAIAENRFAAPTIHDQKDQQVIQTGLYGVVRHPFYAGMLLVYAGVALWLGSYAAAIASVVFLALTVARIVIEERDLRERVPGYDTYARRVRARLIPGLL